MLYGFFADSVVLLHFLWILFLIFGGFWGRRNRLVRYIHLPGLVLAGFVEIFDWYCPLTHLEVWLRRRQSTAGGYTGSFIAHYLERIIYIDLSRRLIVVLTILLLAMNCVIYLRRGNGHGIP
jgi:hypothetical protein